MKFKLLSIAWIVLFMTHALKCADTEIKTLRLFNDIDQTIEAKLTWVDFGAPNNMHDSTIHTIAPQGITTFHRPPATSELLSARAPTNFTIIINNQASTYCLIYEEALDSKIEDNDLLQFNGTAILKGNDSVTHSSRYCDYIGKL